MEYVKRSDLLAIDFYKKAAFKGSIHGMCYRIKGCIREEEQDPASVPEGGKPKVKKFYRFAVTIWPGPKSFEKTDEKLKQTWELEEYEKDFREEDLAAITAYLNQQYEEQKPLWDTVRYV